MTELLILSPSTLSNVPKGRATEEGDSTLGRHTSEEFQIKQQLSTQAHIDIVRIAPFWEF